MSAVRHTLWNSTREAHFLFSDVANHETPEINGEKKDTTVKDKEQQNEATHRPFSALPRHCTSYE